MRSGHRAQIRLPGMRGDLRVLGLVRIGDMVRSVLMFTWQTAGGGGSGQELDSCGMPWDGCGDGVILAQNWSNTGRSPGCCLMGTLFNPHDTMKGVQLLSQLYRRR